MQYSKNIYSYYGNGSNLGSAVNKLNQEGIQELLYTQTEKNSSLTHLTPSGFIVLSGNIIRPKYYYSLKSVNPISPNPYPMAFPLMVTNPPQFVDLSAMSQGLPVQNFELVNTVNRFDDKGNAIEEADKTGTKVSSCIIDNETGNTLAKAINAKFDEIAYCGFESNYSSTGVDYKKGNWNFNLNYINTQYPFLGRCSYQLVNGNGLWTSQNLVAGKRYVASYWLKQGGTADINDGTNLVPNTTSQSTKQLITTYNGWSLYLCEFLAQGSGIGLWGNGFIDELRVYPADAQMHNYNYLPLVGKTSEVDLSDRITFYEYDAFGELSVTRDFQGNIISKTVRVNQGND